MAVAKRSDGSYDVAGDSGTYRAWRTEGEQPTLACSCPAGSPMKRFCSHRIAVQHFLDTH